MKQITTSNVMSVAKRAARTSVKPIAEPQSGNVKKKAAPVKRGKVNRLSLDSPGVRFGEYGTCLLLNREQTIVLAGPMDIHEGANCLMEERRTQECVLVVTRVIHLPALNTDTEQEGIANDFR